MFCYCSAEDTEVPAKGKKLVSTGIAIHTPPGTYGRVAPRSGLACKNFIDVGAGVIDEDYRGEVKVLLFNFGEEAFKGKPVETQLTCCSAAATIVIHGRGHARDQMWT